MDDLEMFPKESLSPLPEVQVQVDDCSDVSVCSLISNRHQSRRTKRNNRKKSRSWSISSKGSDSGLDTGAMSESKGSGHDSSDSDDSRRSRSRRRRRRRRHRSRSSSSGSDSDSSSERRARRRRRRRRRKQRKHRRSRSRAHRDTATRGSRSDSTSSTGSTSRSREREQARRRQRSVDSYGSPLRSRSPDRRRRRSRRARSSERPSPRRTFTGGFGQGLLHGGGGVGQPGSAPEKRVYVGGGGLPAMGERALADLFNQALLAAMHLDEDKERRACRGAPVVSVYLNASKPFGFVELASASLATATLQLDGLLRLDGHAPLRIRRPTDYRPPLAGGEPSVALDLSVFGVKKNNAPAPTAAGGVSDLVPDGPFKVFIGGLPYHMSEADIQTMLTAAGGGPLRALRVVKDQTPQPVTNAGVPLGEGEEKNRGFGFCEFCDPECAQRACQALNGMVLPGAGNRVLSLRMGAAGGNKGSYPPPPQLSLNLPLPPTLLNVPPNPLLLLHRLGQANAGPGLKQVESQSAPTPSLLSALGHESSSSAIAMKVSRPTTPAAFS